MKKLTYQDKIVLLLLESRGEWVPGFKLGKVETKHGWIGSSGERRARELAEDGSYTLHGTKYTVESKIDGKYVYYRISSGARFEQKVNYLEQPDGSRSVKISMELVAV